MVNLKIVLGEDRVRISVFIWLQTERTNIGGQRKQGQEDRETSGSQERKRKKQFLDFKSAAISAQTCTISLSSFLFQLLRIKVQTPNHSTWDLSWTSFISLDRLLYHLKLFSWESWKQIPSTVHFRPLPLNLTSYICLYFFLVSMNCLELHFLLLSNALLLLSLANANLCAKSQHHRMEIISMTRSSILLCTSMIYSTVMHLSLIVTRSRLWAHLQSRLIYFRISCISFVSTV